MIGAWMWKHKVCLHPLLLQVTSYKINRKYMISTAVVQYRRHRGFSYCHHCQRTVFFVPWP